MLTNQVLSIYKNSVEKTENNFNIFRILQIESDEVRLHSRILKSLIELNIAGFISSIPTNYWNKINNLKKKDSKHRNNETIFLLCFNTFFIKAESILRIIKYKISDINLKNKLIEKCLKRKKYYEEIIKKNIYV
jgi:hypothetical protein